jgi:hypothetical protein
MHMFVQVKLLKLSCCHMHLVVPSAGYKVPHGGLFRFVSAANFTAEILEWTGYAIATWSLPGLAFACFTFCNLAPRGVAHHRWYKRNMTGYPADRKAIIPFLW